jgi:predicted DNA-binding protein YlxM (UPF0122 family)
MPAHRKDYEQAVTMYNNGLSIEEIAVSYGMTRQAMHKILRRRNVSLRPNLRFGDDNHFYRGGSLADDHAQNVLEEALEKGRAVRPERCEQCGIAARFADGRTAIQGHHTDYNKPLDVMWLCQKCHHEWHKHNKPIARGEYAQ